MKCIKVLTDKDFGLTNLPMENPQNRLGARGIIFNKCNNKIAILHKQAKNEFKLIGGGLEENENPNDAFIREALEETGCVIEIDDCLGTIEEYKSLDNFHQTSYVFVAHVVNDTHKTNYTKQELEEGSALLWLDINDALMYIKECEDKLIPYPHDKKLSLYHTKFIVRRDYEILKFYKKKCHKGTA